MIKETFVKLWESTGRWIHFRRRLKCYDDFVGFVLLYLIIKKEFEPLLLIPIGFGASCEYHLPI